VIRVKHKYNSKNPHQPTHIPSYRVFLLSQARMYVCLPYAKASLADNFKPRNVKSILMELPWPFNIETQWFSGAVPHSEGVVVYFACREVYSY